ncbi:hypothetical protein [Coprobacillus sp. AF33-1AC]|uniref:hypothetical protein n=1 Tax=Coprobacillus sp. AF33-1AC TaxID=2292032 RepID=UPI000E53F9AC|nr:hypothetical protein [Coprobacillus sp. AF33-1AC]RHM59667.1 hypothetical protein DWZ53_08975 [Coprobacillus sp. AF33-1AC]
MDIKSGKKMNKYQEALDFLQEECRTIKKGEAKQHIKTLQELVDKATPIKPIKIIKRKLFKDGIDMTLAECPECNAVLVKPQSICMKCHQKIKWEKGERINEERLDDRIH